MRDNHEMGGRVPVPSDAITTLGNNKVASLLLSCAKVSNIKDMLNRQTCQGIICVSPINSHIPGRHYEQDISNNLHLWVSTKHNGQDTKKLCRMTHICGQPLKSFMWTVPIKIASCRDQSSGQLYFNENYSLKSSQINLDNSFS